MLIAYLDESCHDKKDLALVAGFVGTFEQWEKCERDWRIALGDRQHLHLKRLRWSNKKGASHLLSRLGPVPHDAGLTAVFSAVRVTDYEDLVDGTHMQKLMKGYFICVLGIVNMLSQELSRHETFKVVLESQVEYANGVIRTHHGSLDHTPDGRKRWASVEFVKKGHTLLTEPGDYLAYALIQQARDPQSAKALLCAPILQNPRPAFARDHRQPGHRELLRTFIKGMAEKYPNLMRSRNAN
jgi:hypothetical protein